MNSPKSPQTNSQAVGGPDKSISSDAPRGNDAKRRVLNWFVFFSLGLLAWQAFPREVARWHQAAYQNHTLNDDLPAALRAIENALRWDQANARYWLEAGHAAMATEDYEKSWQRFDYARELLEKTDPQSVNIAIAQNGGAYARALAGKELDRASADIAEALDVRRDSSAFIDTSGYIRYQQGDLERALEETHLAVSESESTYQVRKKFVRKSLQKSIRRLEMNQQLRQLEEELAELHLHRGLVYQKLGNATAADRDLEQSKAYQDKADRLRPHAMSN